MAGREIRWSLGCVFILMAVFYNSLSAWCYPQYAEWLSQRTKTQVSCTYCHLSSQGPEGSGPGQIGSLTEEQLLQLHTAQSPVLNKFGQSLIKHLGYEKVSQGIFDPEKIVQAMKAYDDDGDGVSNGQEMIHGTSPTDPLSAPLSLAYKSWWQKYAVLICLGAASALLVISLVLFRLYGASKKE